MNHTYAENLARGTYSWMSSAWIVLLATGALNPAEALPERGPCASIQIETCGNASTNYASNIRQIAADALLTEHLVNVFRAMSDGQKELDTDAKNILYSRMRELYRR
jgi:hypothetical protein